MFQNHAATACAVLIALQTGCSTYRTVFPDEWKYSVEKDSKLSSLFETGQGEVFAVPDESIADIPPCQAAMVMDRTCSVVLQTSDGTVFKIGGPGASGEVHYFIQNLDEGETYNFPGAFLESRERFAKEKAK
jgi:hypothetical protein